MNPPEATSEVNTSCPDCGGRWSRLSCTFTDSGVTEVMAAHSCDGIGVLAMWRRVGSGWERVVLDTEMMSVDVGDRDDQAPTADLLIVPNGVVPNGSALSRWFPDFETKDFPEHLCVFQSAREETVLDSEVVYLCVVVDDRFPQECSVKQLRPYTCRDIETNELLFGWTDGDAWVDHFERSVHEDHQRVVAWHPCYGDVSFVRKSR